MKPATKKQMLEYLNEYFEFNIELRTIADDDDNIITKEDLKSLTDEQIEMAYDDARQELRAEFGYLFNN